MSSTIGRGVQYVDHNARDRIVTRRPGNPVTNDMMVGGVPATEGPTAHVHGIHLCRNETDTKPITREEYRRREGV